MKRVASRIEPSLSKAFFPKNTKAGHKIQRNTTKNHDSCAFAAQNNELLKLILNSNVQNLSTSKHTTMKKGASGTEPPTSRSAVACSTTESHSHMPNAVQRYLLLRTISKKNFYSPNIQNHGINYNEIRRKSIINVPAILNLINLSKV